MGPLPALLANACEKFFCVLELDDVGVVVAVDVVDDPSLRIYSEGDVEDADVDGNPPLQIDSEGKVKDANVEGAHHAPNQ
jgi:hypothetical protein